MLLRCYGKGHVVIRALPSCFIEEVPGEIENAPALELGLRKPHPLATERQG